TLETRETLGVPVVVVGSDEFPSFYSHSSGHRAPLRADTPGEVAAMMRAKWDLGLSGAVSVAHPGPVEDEIPAAEISGLIDQALAECAERGITGKDITPFLLGRIVELSGGRSLDTNIALVLANDRFGAALAVEYAALRG